MNSSKIIPKVVVFDIDGVIRDVGGSYRRAIADTVEYYTQGRYRPSITDIDQLKTEGIWNNDWEASQELIRRYWQAQQEAFDLDYTAMVSFFQSRYRGTDPDNWNGYITQEPLLLEPEYLENLSEQGIKWGFFSGATRGSAEYVLKKRLGLANPILIAMEDAPGKPDPTGLLATVAQLEPSSLTPVVYVGDTVADMYTVREAKNKEPERLWIGVGIVPPHLHDAPKTHQEKLLEAGAAIVFNNVQELTASVIIKLCTP